jgi:hypothetical protein
VSFGANQFFQVSQHFVRGDGLHGARLHLINPSFKFRNTDRAGENRVRPREFGGEAQSLALRQLECELFDGGEGHRRTL